MVVLIELMIASKLSMEQVFDCKISLYSPPQAGYGTSSVQSDSWGEAKLKESSTAGKISSTITGNKTASGLSRSLLSA